MQVRILPFAPYTKFDNYSEVKSEQTMKWFIHRCIRHFKLAYYRKRKQSLSNKYTLAIDDIDVSLVNMNPNTDSVKRLNKAWERADRSYGDRFKENC